MEPVEVSETLALKPISRAAIPQALKKAEHYRLLGDPEQAESICLDVLAADPDNQAALVVVVLSMTDQFGRSGPPAVRLAKAYLGRLHDQYQREYYEGLVWEREGRVRLRQSMGSTSAYESLRTAMACYERASALRPADDDESILRWNSCLRTIERADFRPRPAEREVEQPLE
ncbi:MAG TPA: hypothetical protein VJ456_15835 [Acidimicrobiia bacterium]|nr:hypothetical protein [Acidimicrobiia bacterium]HMC41540.1 hypothetical protein [Acidimicrobiales bacterium]